MSGGWDATTATANDDPPRGTGGIDMMFSDYLLDTITLITVCCTGV